MAAVKKNGSNSRATKPVLVTRSWVVSGIVAAVVLSVTLTLSATINPLFGRAVHWDWVAGIAPVTFVAVVLATRKRWV
jgi:uncharacterized membrane protein YdcZ (DUF606 family)